MISYEDFAKVEIRAAKKVVLTVVMMVVWKVVWMVDHWVGEMVA